MVVLFVCGIATSRLSGAIVPLVAAFAPAVCTVCRGCPVEHEHEVCDCESCQLDVQLGHTVEALRDAPHGGSKAPSSFDEPPALVPPLLRVLPAPFAGQAHAVASPRLSSRPDPRPPTPPPRA